MAIPVGGTPSTQGDTATNTPTTKAHTTGAGETYMLVKVGMLGVTLGTVSTVAFGAFSLTLIKGQTGTSTTSIRGELWGGTVPESTADTVTVTYAASNCNATVAIISYTNVDSVGTFKFSVETSGTTSSVVFEAGEVGDDTLITDMLVTHFGDADPTPGATQEYASFQDGGSQTKQEGSYNAAGGNTLSWTGLNHSNRDSIQIGVPLIGEETPGGGGFAGARGMAMNGGLV